jgi:RNA polymerase sigma-70 factor (ECF subfamily)
MLTMDRPQRRPRRRWACSPRCALLCTEDGLAQAYREHKRELTGYCHRLLLDHGLAEEITQEVFLRAWRACSAFTDLGGVPGLPDRRRASLFTIARNAVIDAVRRRDRRTAMHPDPDRVDHEPDPRDGYARFETAEQVHRALGTLLPQHRAVLTAVYLESLDHSQVGQRLGIPVGTVKSRVHYGLRALRAWLDTEASGEQPAPARCA